MVEAIGAQYLDTYFDKLTRLLKPDGLALLQAITIEDQRYEQALASVDYIKRLVFPGSFIPSINAILAAKTRSSDLRADPARFRPVLRADPARLARALHGASWRRCARRASTSASSACGSSTWPTAKAASWNAPSVSSHLLMARPGNRRAALLPARPAEWLHDFWASVIGNQLVWLCAVIGAGHGLRWPALLALVVYVGRQLGCRRSPAWNSACWPRRCCCGCLLDGGLMRTRLGAVRRAWPSPAFAPVWILALWAAFAMTFTGVLCVAAEAAVDRRWSGLRGGRWRIWARRAAGRCGEFAAPTLAGPAVAGVGWALATPLLAWLARRWTSGTRSPRSLAGAAAMNLDLLCWLWLWPP